jgi:hypothetical protein
VPDHSTSTPPRQAREVERWVRLDRAWLHQAGRLTHKVMSTISVQPNKAVKRSRALAIGGANASHVRVRHEKGACTQVPPIHAPRGMGASRPHGFLAVSCAPGRQSSLAGATRLTLWEIKEGGSRIVRSTSIGASTRSSCSSSDAELHLRLRLPGLAALPFVAKFFSMCLRLKPFGTT